jgi:FkbM family methyltransferase
MGGYSAKKHEKEIKQFESCYHKNKSKFKEVYNLLEDEESRQTYKAVMEFRRTYEYKALKGHISYPQYFVKEIFRQYKDEIFVDGGAYTGDTIISMAKSIEPKLIKKIYAWEPDNDNGKALQNEVSCKFKEENTEVVWIPCALYKESKTLMFSNDGNACSQIVTDGGVSVEADSIDNRCPDATFIKMDIEGAEIDALYGAKNTIIKNKPKLAICIYHSNEHLYEIPLLIHEWVPEYKLYIRHHGEMAAETVLYAIMPE